ncbi:uncharacterized protein LOC122255987 [Penaeus japonicus]|uniref:uncharacterized protein LOC122255987 n=1 Tax=Penaeus japonicus TaxID=27405 RepID=UPI001C70DC24|nr:uncharacterized protein LOC122255987 [Penaeus japonicus]
MSHLSLIYWFFVVVLATADEGQSYPHDGITSDYGSLQGTGFGDNEDDSRWEIRSKTVETIVVQDTSHRQIMLVAVLGACIGLLGGFLITVILCCSCHFMRRDQGILLRFDKGNNSYRSADVIDGGV